MTDDLYAPPKTDPVPPSSKLPGEAAYYLVSLKKFWLLYGFTMGLYEVYWFFRHWQAQKQSKREGTLPVMRALFAIFFVHSLFDRIHAKNPPGSRPLSGLATAFVLLTIGTRIVSALAENGIGSPWTAIGEFGLFLPTGFCLAAAQKQANVAGGDPLGAWNTVLTPVNALWMALGLAFWGATLYGLLTKFRFVEGEG